MKPSDSGRATWLPFLALVLTIGGFLLAYQFVQPAPPRQLAIATGSAEGAYHAFALRYRDFLARHGLELEVRTSAGSLENLRQLRDPESDVAVALVQSGISQATENDPLLALGSLYFEPVWVFHRADVPVEDLTDLRGKRIGAGQDGSGTRNLALRLLEDAGVAVDTNAIRSLTSSESAAALKGGDLDAAFFIASPDSGSVRELLTAPDVRLLHFRRAEAYSRRLPSLSRVTLPEGVIDLGRNIPDRDVDLVAPVATLLCRDDFHPALIDLLLQAATAVHSGEGLFESQGEFPSPASVDFPLSPDARRFFKHGPPFLQRFLPFWAATLIDRLKVMLLPLVFLLLPFIKVVPPLYRWKIRSRIYRWYEQLREVDAELHGKPDADLARLEAEIEEIEGEVRKVSVPLSYGQELYALRVHIDLLREKIDKRSRPGSIPAIPE